MVDIEQIKAEAWLEGYEYRNKELLLGGEAKERRPETVEFIRDMVCEYYGVLNSDLIPENRQREIVLPRQVIMYLLVLCGKITTTSTAKMYNRDHTTVLHSIKVVKNLMDTDVIFKDIIENFKSRIYEKFK